MHSWNSLKLFQRSYSRSLSSLWRRTAASVRYLMGTTLGKEHWWIWINILSPLIFAFKSIVIKSHFIKLKCKYRIHLTHSNFLLSSNMYLQLFGTTFDVMFILTHLIIELPPRNVFQPSIDGVRKEHRTVLFSFHKATLGDWKTCWRVNSWHDLWE